MTAIGLVFDILALVLASSSPGPAFTFPVDCELGQTCLIQKYFDHDPTAGRSDYRCGKLTTDGHQGTDIRVRTMADMRRGVSVVAAQAGTVLRIRDGEPDTGANGGRSAGKDAGNAVVIDHGSGWETQYSHLRNGSLKVRPGQQVESGEAIGLVGLSGNSEFPHLHFAVRRNGVAVDPFLPAGPASVCAVGGEGASLWANSAARHIAYAPAGVISAGLSSVVPPRGVMERDPAPGVTDAQAPLIFWVDVFGTRAGDRQEFTILAPGGAVVHRQLSEIEDGGLSWFSYSGKRPLAGGWSKGRYIGRYRLLRGDTVVGEVEATDVLQ